MTSVVKKGTFAAARLLSSYLREGRWIVTCYRAIVEIAPVPRLFDPFLSLARVPDKRGRWIVTGKGDG